MHRYFRTALGDQRGQGEVVNPEDHGEEQRKKKRMLQQRLRKLTSYDDDFAPPV